MNFKLPRQILNDRLCFLVSGKIKKHKIDVPRAKRKYLIGVASAVRKICKWGLPPHLVRKKLPGKLGYGIFLHPKALPIAKGEVIAPYAGEVSLCPKESENDSDYIFGLVDGFCLTKEEQRLFDPRHRHHPRRIYSLDLDAEKKGNFTRFINHSEKPNVEAELFRIPVNQLGLKAAPCEILYIAKKTIRPGEQLLVCYEGKEKTYWGALRIKPFPMTPRTFRLDTSLNVIPF